MKPESKQQIAFHIQAHLHRCVLIGLLLTTISLIPVALADRTPRGKTDESDSNTKQPRAGGNLQTVVASPTPSCRSIIDEGFDNIGDLSGWVLLNHSEPLGPGDWLQGNGGVFAAFDGAANAYIATTSNNGDGVATISNWILMPEVTFQEGNSLTFYTRTTDSSDRPDRLQVRMSLNGPSTNVGVSAFDVGDFTNFLLDINPTYAIGGYPETWTQFTINIGGITPGTTGRLAFRYFVENGGPGGVNSNYIGIDRVVYCVTTLRKMPTPRPQPTPAPRR